MSTDNVSGTSGLFSVYLGMNAKIYVGGQEFANVKDVTMNFSRSTADVTTRANDGWRANVGTLREATASFQMVKYQDNTGDNTNNDAETILSAFLGRGGSDLPFSTRPLTRAARVSTAIGLSLHATVRKLWKMPLPTTLNSA